MTLCPGCDEGVDKSEKWYDFEGLKKVISESLEYLVDNNTRFFLYGKNIFRLPYFEDIMKFIWDNPEIKIDFHLTTDMTGEEIEILRHIAPIENLYFTFCQSYKTIDFEMLHNIVEILAPKPQKSFVVIVAQKDYEIVESYFAQIKNPENLILTLSKYPSFLWKKALGTWLKRCEVLDTFSIREHQLVLHKGVLLEVLPGGDLRLHNYLCNLAGINITNMYKTYDEALKDMKRFLYFYHIFHSRGDFESNCYTCIKKVHYHYKKIYDTVAKK